MYRGATAFKYFSRTNPPRSSKCEVPKSGGAIQLDEGPGRVGQGVVVALMDLIVVALGIQQIQECGLAALEAVPLGGQDIVGALEQPALKFCHPFAHELVGGKSLAHLNLGLEFGGFQDCIRLLSEELGGFDLRALAVPKWQREREAQGDRGVGLGRGDEVLGSLGRVSKAKGWFDNGDQDYAAKVCEYDLLGRVLVERVEDGHGQTLHQVHYAYDLEKGIAPK